VPGAVDWYRLSVNAPLSYPAYEWRVRSALAIGDWTMVRWATESMPGALRSRPAWVYWHGRALKALGDPVGAAADFGQISSRFDFYGQLATEELGNPISVPPRTTVTDDEIRAMRNLPGFTLAQRFYAMNLRFEGNREWNWTLRGMTDRQLLAAAQYAKSIELYDRVVNTADRTQQEHDFTLRYAAPFKDIVERDAKQNELDVEWAYGLIRQESRFVIAARSGVGAQGLMQLMPGTANLVARKIGLGTLSSDQMSDIDTNILLGTTYLSMVYNQFDGSAVLASAAYNAGPGRSRQWKAALTKPEEGAIFAETIPFSETRDYVKNVLSNTVYYAALFEGKPQSLKVRLGFIEP
jgi:soluble lytic murein transglycosylase